MRFNFFYANAAVWRNICRMSLRLRFRFRCFPDIDDLSRTMISPPISGPSRRTFLQWTGILALLFSSVLLVGCKKPTQLNSSSNPPVDYQLPMKLSVEDSQGRTLTIQLLSRTDKSMTFVRLSDNLEFTTPLNQLSPEDRALVRKFPKTIIKPQKDTSVAGQYIATRRKAIERLTRDIDEIRLLLATEDITKSTSEAKKKEAQRKFMEISKMKDQIAEKQKSR